jgi:hypothetical protein
MEETQWLTITTTITNLTRTRLGESRSVSRSKETRSPPPPDLFVGDAVYEAHGHTRAGELDASVARQLAVARALSGLAHQLVDDASHTVGRVARAVATVSDETSEAYIVLE